MFKSSEKSDPFKSQFTTKPAHRSEGDILSLVILSADTSTGRSAVIVQNSLQGTHTPSPAASACGAGRCFASPHVFNSTV